MQNSGQLNNLDPRHIVGLVNSTHRENIDLLEWIMLAFGQPYEGMSKVACMMLQRFLIEQRGSDKRVLLIIDEAQNLSPDALESLRMLPNNNSDKSQLL